MGGPIFRPSRIALEAERLRPRSTFGDLFSPRGIGPQPSPREFIHPKYDAAGRRVSIFDTPDGPLDPPAAPPTPPESLISRAARRLNSAYESASEFIGGPKQAIDLSVGLGADYLKERGYDLGIDTDRGNEAGQLLRKTPLIAASEAYANKAFDYLPEGVGDVARGAMEGALDKGTALATDPLMAAIPGSRIAAAAFLPGIAHGAGEELGAAGAALQEGNYREAAQLGAGGLVDTGFALLGGLHAGRRGPSAIERQAARLREQEAAQAPTPEVAPAAPTLRRAALLDEGLPPTEPVAPGPELGYGRGGIPAGEPPTLEGSIQQALQGPPGGPRLSEYASPESLGLQPLENVVAENVRRRMVAQGAADQQALANMEGQPLEGAIQGALASNIPTEPRLAPPPFGPARPSPIPGLGEDFTLSPAAEAAARAREPRQVVTEPIQTPPSVEPLARPEALGAIPRQPGETVANVVREGSQALPGAPVIPPDAVGPEALQRRAPTVAQPILEPPLQGERRGNEPALREGVQRFVEDNPEATREQLAGEVRRLRTEARTDSLTGLQNKRGWDEIVKTVNPDTDHVVAVDLRGFKTINDRYGHAAGDDSLRAVATVLRKHLGDDSARPGGDEFGAVLRGVTPEEATARVEAFRAELKGITVPVRMPDGTVLDIPGFEAHLGVGRNATAADLASNAARDLVGSGRVAPAPVQRPSGPVEGALGRAGEGRPDLAEAVEPAPSRIAPLGISQKKWDRYVRARSAEIERQGSKDAKGKRIKADWRRVPDPPKDKAGNPIIPGQENWTPQERTIARQHAENVLREIEAKGRSQPVSRRGVVDVRGAGSGDMTGAGYSVTSHKAGTAFEDLPYEPREMVQALKVDKGNPIEQDVLEAASKDYKLQAEEFDAREPPPGVGDETFDPAAFEGEQPRYSVKPTPGQRGIPGVGEDVQPRAPRKARPDPEATVEPEPLKPGQVYYNGFLAEYTGKTEHDLGTTWHQIRFLEGPNEGKTRITQNAPPSEADAPRYAVKPRPGQRGIEGIGEDIAQAKEKKKGPEQTAMFGGEMLQQSAARVTEGREGEGALFNQERAARERAEATAQGGLFDPEAARKRESAELGAAQARDSVVGRRAADAEVPPEPSKQPYEMSAAEKAEAAEIHGARARAFRAQAAAMKDRAEAVRLDEQAAFEESRARTMGQLAKKEKADASATTPREEGQAPGLFAVEESAPPAADRGISDFGEKIGGARKDVARPLGPRGTKVETEPKPEGPAWRRQYRAAEIAAGRDKGKWMLVRKGNDLRQAFDSREAAEAAIPLAELAHTHQVHGNRGADGKIEWVIARKLGERRRPTVKGGFETDAEARRYMVEHADEILSHKFPFPDKPWLDRIERQGPEYRKGDVKPVQFQEAFGFRGGEFGNWNMGSDGQAALNHAYDGLMDLSRSLGVPPKALSLNGDLAIAFGARGHGGKDSARAHYEPDRAVINLTKVKGAGSLAHEWFHALDHYLSKESGGRSLEGVSHGFPSGKARPELKAAFERVMREITASEKTQAVEGVTADKAAGRMAEGVSSVLAEIKRGFTYEPYKARLGSRLVDRMPTAEELARFDAIAERIKAGDVGERKTIEGKGRFNFRSSYEPIEELNALYKKVRGNSFATADQGSRGHQLASSVQSMLIARKRVEAAKAGATETKRGPSEFLRHSRDIDQYRASDYWSTPHEMAARAFEAFAYDKLRGATQRSDYLTHSVENKDFVMTGMKPYPEGVERQSINKAFDGLFETIKTKETEKGTALYRATDQPGTGISIRNVRAAFPSGRVDPHGGGFIVRLPHDRTIRVDVRGEIAYRPEAFEKGYGRKLKEGEEEIVGSWNRIGRDGIIQLAKASADQGTVHHEAFHAAMDLALNKNERRAVLKKYGNEEAAAEAYAKWEPTKPHGLFQRIRSFFQRIYNAFKPSAESAFGRVRSGEAFGTPGKPAPAENAAAVRQAAARVEENPSPAQRNAENFRKGHLSWNGLDIAIEVPLGGTRTAKDGSWKVEDFPAHYGSIKRTTGKDGDAVDVFMGPKPESDRVFVVDQKNPKTGAFDEIKALVGFANEKSATDTYKSAYNDGLGEKLLGDVTEMSATDFKRWALEGDTKKPLGGVAPEKYATAPKQPPQVKPIPPTKEAVTEKSKEEKPLGRPMRPGEAPRVEHKVAALGPDVDLSRDAPRTWESLDPEIRTKLHDIATKPANELALYERARTGRLNDVEVQTLDALVTGKRESYENVRERLLKAQESGRDTGPENTAYLKAALDRAAAELALAARSDVEAGTKLARALAARARVMEAAGKSTPDHFLRKVFREIPDITDEQAGGLLKILQERPQDLSDALIAATKPARFDQFLEAWKAGLVSGLPTQGGNILGNFGEQLVRMGETVTAAALDPLLGGPKTRLGGEARFELGGAMKGISKSMGRLGTDLRDIVKLAPEKIDLDNLDRLPKIGGTKGRVIRIPFRLLSAFDDFFKGVGGEAELHKLAYRRSEGDHVAARRLIESPPDDLMAEVTTSRLERTFQNPNKMANAIMTFRSNQKWAHVVAPFVQTPSNIARVTWQRSPAGFYEGFKALHAYREAMKTGADQATVARLKGEAVDKLARPLFGTAILASFYAVAKSGGMTGSGPVDAKDRNTLRSAGWQPYSFVIPVEGDKRLYVPFSRFEPVSSIFGMAADAAEIQDQKKAGDMFDKALGSIIQNFTSKTYLQGITDAAAAIADPKQFASQYASGLAGSLVPTIVAKGAQVIDSKVRDTKPSSSGITGIPERIAKTIVSRIPGASLALPVVKSPTGEDAERPGGALLRFLSPVLMSVSKPDADVKSLLVEIDAAPSTPRRDLTIPKSNGRKVRLDDREYAVLTAAAEHATARVKGIVRSAAFKRMPIEEQRAYVRRVYDRYETAARKRLYASPTFRARAMEARRAGAVRVESP